MQYSVVNCSEVMSHKDKRMDSEHYHPCHLNNLEKYKGKSKRLGDYILHMSGGATPLGAIYPETGIPFLRVENIMQNCISESNMVYITDEQHQTIARSELKENDVLLTITGVSFGKSAVVTEQFQGSNINQHSVKMTVAGISPHFLASFLNCKYGYSQSARHVVGVTRPALDYSAIRSFYIPDLSDAFQGIVEYVCLQAETARENSFSVYHQAQLLLLLELGLTDWQPDHRLWFVKYCSDIQQAERFDADYFQPKYDEVVDAIQNYPGGWGRAGDLLNLKAKNHNPDGAREYKYIELANITENGEVAGCTTAQGRDLPSRARCEVSENDVIVSSVEGSLEKIAMIREEYGRESLCSTGFHIIDSDMLNPETLLVFLKSPAGLLQLKKGCSGTILTAISEDEFRKIVLPKISPQQQARIKEKVSESFALSKQSKHLLECAKQAVEIAIEKNERVAVKWLEKETGEV